jgi:hypothetical protein
MHPLRPPTRDGAFFSALHLARATGTREGDGNEPAQAARHLPRSCTERLLNCPSAAQDLGTCAALLASCAAPLVDASSYRNAGITVAELPLWLRHPQQERVSTNSPKEEGVPYDHS